MQCTSKGNLKSKCVTCNQITKKGVLEKHRTEEDSRAEMFIETAKANLDDAYERINDCCDMGRLFAADILYHAP